MCYSEGPVKSGFKYGVNVTSLEEKERLSYFTFQKDAL